MLHLRTPATDSRSLTQPKSTAVHIWLVQVQEPPTWLEEPQDVRGVEGGAILMGCRAEGSPIPYYTWLDSNGNDVTRKSGIKSGLNIIANFRSISQRRRWNKT